MQLEALKRAAGNLRSERLTKKIAEDAAELATDEATRALEALSVRV